MKMNITHIMALSGVLLFAACNDFLDELPDNRTDVDTPEKVAKILVSAYALSTPITMHELMSDNVDDLGNNIETYFDIYGESYQFRDITSMGTDSPFSIWETNYSAIAAANTALLSIEEMEYNGSHDLSAQKGEALLCRAYAHFTLCNTFCQAYNSLTSSTDLGIPYMKDVEITAINTYERGTVAETYKQINEDIEAGIPLLDDNLYHHPKYHFNRRAAYAFAAQFNLYYGNYQKAKDYATVAIGENPSSLARDYSEWNSYSNVREYCASWVSSDDAANFLIQPLFSYAGAYYTYRYVMTKALLSEILFSAGPWTGVIHFSDPKIIMNYASRSYLFPKQTYYFEYTDQVAGIGYYHVVAVPFSVEKTLIDRAEANAMLGYFDDAARDLSYFYTGSGADAGADAAEISNHYASFSYNKEINPKFNAPIDAGIQKNMIHACLHARRMLTIHEGTRLQDIKRYGIRYEHIVKNGTNINIEPYDKRLAIQIPEPVIAAGMAPNPR